MPTDTFDPTLSDLFLNFQAYPESISINFKDRITQFYNYEPVYFSPSSNNEINVQLRIFTDSSPFEIFTSQLEHCFSKIAAFINTHNIQVTTTTLIIMISNIAHEDFQGEAMGLALSFRALGDGIICLIGGFLITIMLKLPILLSSIFAIIALLLMGNKKIIYHDIFGEQSKIEKTSSF